MGIVGTFFLLLYLHAFFTVLLQAFIQQFIVDILVLLNFCSNMNILQQFVDKAAQKLRAFQIFRKKHGMYACTLLYPRNVSEYSRYALN